MSVDASTYDWRIQANPGPPARTDETTYPTEPERWHGTGETIHVSIADLLRGPLAFKAGDIIEIVGGVLTVTPRPIRGARPLNIRLSFRRWVLMLRLVRAAIHAADRSGIDSDRVWALARQIKALREARP